MKFLMLKTFRDIRETIGSFISILIVIFIGCFFFAGIAEATTSVTTQVEDYCAAQNIASARATFMFVNSAAVEEIAADSGVKKAEGYDTFYTKIKGSRTDITLSTLTDGIDEPKIMSGKMPKTGEIIVDSVYANAHRVKLGDTVEFSVDALKKITLSADGYNAAYESKDYAFTVSGIFHSPDVLRKVDVMNTATQSEDFMLAHVNYGEVKSFTDDAVVSTGTVDFPFAAATGAGVKVYNGVKIIGTPKEKKVFEKYTVGIDNLFDVLTDPAKAAGLHVVTLKQKDYPAQQAYNGINDAIKSLAAVLPFIFFAVAAAITVISLSKTVDNQRMQIGVIQALGIAKRDVYFSYIFYALFACVIGGLSGGLVGTFTVPYLLEFIYEGQFSMPPTPLNIGVAYTFIGVAIAAGLACISAFLSCHKTLKVAPAQAMRPKPPKKTKRILAERWTGLWKRLGFGAKMNMRNMFLHKIRMLLSSVGIVGCLALLIGLVGMKDNMAFSFNHYDYQTGYDMTVYLTETADVTDEQSYALAQNEKLDKYTLVPAFSAKFSYKGKSEDQTLMALPAKSDVAKYATADPDCVRLYEDISQKKRLVIDKDTLAIPEVLADKLNVSAGDTVTVNGRTLDGETIEFTAKVTAVVCEYFEQNAYCSYDFFTAHGISLVADSAYARTAKGAEVKATAEQIEESDDVRIVQVFRDSYEELEDRMALLDYAVWLFVIGAGVLAVAVIYNITATNLKERTREIATLMVLGYKKRETANMLLVENMVITAIGCLLGLPFGYILLDWLVSLTQSFSVFISGFMSWYTSLGCIALTFFFSFVATMFLNRKLKKISMVEALKSVE